MRLISVIVCLVSTLVAAGCDEGPDLAAGGAAVQAEDARVRVALEPTGQSGPPFYVEVSPVAASEGEAWGEHRLIIGSEWSTRIAIDIGGGAVTLGRRSEFTPSNEFVIVEPGGEVRLPVTLTSGESELEPGIYAAVVEVGFWRDVAGDSTAAPGIPDRVLEFSLVYELLTPQVAGDRELFCESAAAALEDAPSRPGELREALATIRMAAVDLDDQRRDVLVDEIESLDRLLRRVEQGDPGVSGWDAFPIVDLINAICGTDLPSAGVQS